MKYWLITPNGKYLYDSPCDDISTLKSFISEREGISSSQQQLLIGGRHIHNLPIAKHSDGIINIHVCLSLNGGMPKKKKKKGGKKKGAKKKKKEEEEAKPDEFDFMNVDELSKIKTVLSEKLNGIEEERSYFQLERDFLQKMYDIVHEHEYAENCINYKNMESDLESLKNNHRNNIRMYVQKVKHLEYDHTNTMNSISMEAEMTQNEEKNHHQIKKDKLLQNKQILASELLKNKILNEDEVKSIEQSLNVQIETIENEFCDKLGNLDKKYFEILSNLKSDLNLETKLQIHEIEERKNLHINDLICNHEKSFNKMKQYYNDITRDNLDLIRSLKTELNELENKIKNHESKYQNILNENKKLNLPLNEAKSEVKVFDKKLVNYNKDKRSLKSNQKHLLSLTNKLNVLKKSNANLKNDYQRLLDDKSNLIGKYAKNVSEKDENANENEGLRKELNGLQNEYESKQDELNKILNEANLDKVVINHLTNKLNKIVDHKNAQIEEKRYDICRIQKMHDDLLRVYQSKIKELNQNVPDDQLFHVQYINNVKGATIPAGFVGN